MQRRLLIQAAATLAGAPLVARGQDKPITVVLGFSAGSALDIAARILANNLPSELGGRKVIVDNRSGAGGTLAFVGLKQASADGSVLAFAPSNLLTIFPRTYSKLSYNAGDVTPIATACTVDFAFVVAHNHPAKTLAEFVAWAKANPKQASIGNPGLGTAQHFLGWLFGKAAGVDLEGVPYRSTPQMAQELAGGQIAGAIAVQAVFMELVRAGRLRMLATTGETRTRCFRPCPPWTRPVSRRCAPSTGSHSSARGHSRRRRSTACRGRAQGCAAGRRALPAARHGPDARRARCAVAEQEHQGGLRPLGRGGSPYRLQGRLLTEERDS